MNSLLTLFDSISKDLGELTELAKRKTTAVRRNDLTELNQILKEEQALALSLRGLEQKRAALLAQLGLQDLPLQDVPGKAGDALLQRAKTSVENLRKSYEIYRSAAETARNTLECNLHEIEKFLAASGADVSVNTGYRPVEVDPPAPMKADFRA